MSNARRETNTDTCPTDYSLPPLPKKVVIYRAMPDDYRYGNIWGYTSKQMIEYARLCLVENIKLFDKEKQ